MNLQYYRNFIAIVECGNILGASRKILIAQPALSNQLKALEAEYGARLLHRGARTVTLTEAGQILYKKAKTICELDDAAQREIADSLAGIEGTLAISLTATNGEVFIQKTFSRFIRDFPRVRLKIQETTSPEVGSNLLDGISEIGYIRAAVANQSLFRIYPIKSGQIIAAIPQNHPLAAKSKLTLEDLFGVPLIAPRGCLQTVGEAFARVGQEPDYSVVTTSGSLAIELAKIKNCVALVSFCPGDFNQSSGIRLCPITNCDLPADRAFITAKNARLSVAALNFLKYQGIDA